MLAQQITQPLHPLLNLNLTSIGERQADVRAGIGSLSTLAVRKLTCTAEGNISETLCVLMIELALCVANHRSGPKQAG